MPTTIPAHSLGNTTFFLHTFIINLHSPFFFILTHLYSYFVIHFYPLKTVDQTVESLYFLNIFSQRSSLKIFIWTNLGKYSLFVWLCVSGIKTGRRRIIHLDELGKTFVVCLVMHLWYKDRQKTHYLSA